MVLIYQNRIVPSGERFLVWYQYAECYGSIGLVAIPLLIWAVRFLTYRWKVLRSKPKKVKNSFSARVYLNLRQAEFTKREKTAFPEINTFGMFFGQDEQELFSKGFDLLILDEYSVWRLQRPPKTQEVEKSPQLKAMLCLVQRPKIDHASSDQQKLAAVFDKVQPLQNSPNFFGLVLPADILPKAVFNEFLKYCRSLNTTIVLQSSPPFTDIQGVDFSFTDGVIFENATIHTDGQRRDYFQAADLREGLGRCARQRESRTFFIGFHDLWETRPEPAIIRRAFKMAKFFGASLQIGYARGLTEIDEFVPIEMCLSGFDWLKRDDVMAIHKHWSEETKQVQCEDYGDENVARLDYEPLIEILQGIDQALELHPVEEEDDQNFYFLDMNPITPTDYVIDAPKRNSFWSSSSLNDILCPIGCYDLSEEVMQEHFDAVLKTQDHLRELNMLHQMTDIQVHSTVMSFRRLLAFYSEELYRSSIAEKVSVIQPLIEGMLSERILVFQGLDTGFAVPNHEARLWAVTRIIHTEGKDKLVVYISQRTPDFNGTLLHAYLALAGISREQRFVYEAELARAMDPNIEEELPPRVLAELNASTYAELLTMLSQLQVTSTPRSRFFERVEEICHDLLLRDASRLQWRELHSKSLLKGDVSSWEVLDTRLTWYRRKGAKYLPRLNRLERLFEIIDNAVLDALYDMDRHVIDLITTSLTVFSSKDTQKVDIASDLFALMVFSAFRKYAFEDVYLEATDRCPLFHQQPDQAGVFAELWVLGSQCEIYFDITPRGLGDVIYHRYRNYLKLNPPPVESWNGKDLYTAYTKIDNPALPEAVIEQPKTGWRAKFKRKDTIEGIKKYGYLSIFCVPAIVDVCLLSFLGRGLYLTGFMHDIETLMGTYALLTALLICAGVTGWVGSGGGFYLFNFAFDSLNHFMIQRFVGGLMLSTAVSICAFIAFGLEYSWYGGTIFVLYFNFLSPYLNLLGILATMHREGSPLQSGRLALAKCMFILLLSPIITTFYPNHDIVFYIPIMYLFLFTLLYNYRGLCIKWSSWLEKIVMLDDNKIFDWYVEEYENGDNAKIPKDDETARSALLLKARDLLNERVQAEDGRLSLFQSKEGELVKSLAAGYHESVWLLKKDSNGNPIPDAYSPTWHVQLKVSLNTQRLFVRGLKEHSPFILFRYSKYDIGQNVSVFLIALLDRWVAIAMSANGFSLNLYIEFRARYGICFALLYFLSGAVALDSHIQHCWVAVTEKVKINLTNPDEQARSQRNEQNRKRSLYYKALYELAILMMFLLGIFIFLLWLFVTDREETILFFGYAYGYSCVLFFQFNRVFTRDIKLYVWSLMTSATIGFFVGVVLHSIEALHLFKFNDIIALSTASTLGSIASFYLTDFSPQPTDEGDTQKVEKINWKLYSQKFLGLQTGDPCLRRAQQVPSMDEINNIFYYPGDPMSDRIEKILLNSRPICQLSKGLPALSSYRALTLERWKSGATGLFLTTAAGMKTLGAEHSVAVGVKRDLRLDVYTFVPGISPHYVSEEQAEIVAYVLAESILHETCEALFSLSHSDATLAETCLGDSDRSLVSTRMMVQLEHSDMRSITRICERTNIEMMKHLTFGLAVSTEWVALPEDVRRFIIARTTNRTFYPTADMITWVSSLSKEPWRIVVDRHTLRLHQCLAIHRMASALYRRDVQPRPFSYLSRAAFSLPDLPATDGLILQQITQPPDRGLLPALGRGIVSLYQSGYTFIKFTAIISSAGSDAGRELWYTVRHMYGRTVLMFFVLKAWQLARVVRAGAVKIFLLHHRPVVEKLVRVAKYGIPRTLTSDSITVDDPQHPVTGFLFREEGFLKIDIYPGLLQKKPEDPKNRVGTGEYDEMQRLKTLNSGKMDNQIVTSYEYDDRMKKVVAPRSKTVMRKGRVDKIYYDAWSRESHGSIFAADREWYFEYLYTATPANSRNILKSRYTSLDPLHPAVYSVYWCVIPAHEDGNTRKWKPYEKITRLVYSYEGRTWDTTWTYNHQRHPTLSTVYLEDGEIRFLDEPCKEATTDVCGFFKKPQNVGFEAEDPLYFHSPKKIGNTFSNSLGRSVRFTLRKRKIINHEFASTARLRTILWQQWATASNLDAVSACYIDEIILREEKLLRPYWNLRDNGHFRQANNYIRSKIGIIAATIEVTDDISQNTFLSIKIGDLLTMGTAKDANHITLRPEDAVCDGPDRLSVMFLDTGCWPDAPGGVSNCRRDLVNGHTTIRNHVLAESANDYGVPRYQVERNVNSLKVLPLWGLDGKTPFHGMFDNLLDAQIEQRIRRTSISDVENTFIPLLCTIVKGSRMINYTQKDLVVFTNAFMNINKYFEEKDYNKTWRSKEVLRAWQNAWLKPYDDPNVVNVNDFFEIEKPTLSNLDEALELWICYFFVYSVKLPEVTPTVFQSTHHGVGSLYGMLLKLRRGVAWGIWDHAIMWRESCLNVSTAQCLLPIPVQNMLLGVMKLAAHLAYTHADVILPCTSVYNPDWEADLGTDLGRRTAKKEFRRKIDPVTNGIGNMGSFQPVTECTSKEPTCVMLSNVQFIKDVKNAVQAADVIINTFGFKTYHLTIYGAMDRTPAYTVETQQIISSRGLSGLVKLGGFGSPKTVLKEAWLFMNSSLSEGLPLAIGEAALSGIPIVATEVGATAQVLTDPDDPEVRYGEVVPPNDPVALARAQISLLAMLGPWTKYTTDEVTPPALPDTFTPEDVEWITKRMYDKADDRRALGLRLRDVVLRSFHGDRYLREHEQMYWAQSYLARQRRDVALTSLAIRQNKFGKTKSMRVDEIAEVGGLWDEPKWQDFDDGGRIWDKFRRREKLKLERTDSQNSLLDHEPSTYV